MAGTNHHRCMTWLTLEAQRRSACSLKSFKSLPAMPGEACATFASSASDRCLAYWCRICALQISSGNPNCTDVLNLHETDALSDDQLHTGVTQTAITMSAGFGCERLSACMHGSCPVLQKGTELHFAQTACRSRLAFCSSSTAKRAIHIVAEVCGGDRGGTC